MFYNIFADVLSVYCLLKKIFSAVSTQISGPTVIKINSVFSNIILLREEQRKSFTAKLSDKG